MKIRKNLITLNLLLAIFCVSVSIPFTSGNTTEVAEIVWPKKIKKFDAKITKKIKKGETTLDQALKRLGRPYKVDRTSDEGATILVFRHSEVEPSNSGSIRIRMLNLELRVIDNIVVDYHLVKGMPGGKYKWTNEGRGESP